MHVVVNLSIIIGLWVGAMAAIQLLLDPNIWLNLLISPIVFVLIAYIGQRFVPKITNSFIERR